MKPWGALQLRLSEYKPRVNKGEYATAYTMCYSYAVRNLCCAVCVTQL